MSNAELEVLYINSIKLYEYCEVSTEMIEDIIKVLYEKLGMIETVESYLKFIRFNVYGECNIYYGYRNGEAGIVSNLIDIFENHGFTYYRLELD